MHSVYYVEVPLSFYFLHFLYKNTNQKKYSEMQETCIDFMYIKKSKLLENVDIFRLNLGSCKFPTHCFKKNQLLNKN